VRTISPPPPLTIPALADRLRVVLARTARRLRQEAGSEIGPALVMALGTVERHGPLTPSALAERERIQRPTATRLIASLEAHGLIVRNAAPGDARSSVLSITDRGSALLLDHRARKDAFLAKRLQELPAADRATLARAADLLEALLQDGERS
jgi:DNA-binding MarR family transcriptional regulator